MAPPALKKLITLQQSRYKEMQDINTRVKEKERDTFNVNIIKVRIVGLNNLWNDVRKTHEDIITREDSADLPYVSDDHFTTYTELYEETLDFLATLQGQFEANRQLEPAARAGDRNNTSSSDPELRAAKLPKLELPTFSGRYEDWENFCDLFTTLVHEAPQLADATKLQYLKSCLKDTAADLVKDVATTNANYLTTWQALKARFHNPRLIVFNHLRSLLDMAHLKRESAVELRSFADEAQRIVRALENLKMPVQHWDIWFVFILSARLDPDSRKAWETELSIKDCAITSGSEITQRDEDPLARFPRFKDLAIFLENRARTLSMIATQGTSDKKSNVAVKGAQGGRKAFYSAPSETSNDGKPKCPICNGSHKLHKCYKFKSKTPTKRRKEIRQRQLCYNCFCAHKAAECPSQFRCKTCSGKHHSLIHMDPADSSQSTNQGPHNRDKPSPSLEESHTPTPNVHTASFVSQRHSVILATSQLTVVGTRGRHTRVRALLDQGSETSFVTSKIVNILNMRTQRTRISLNGIGNKSAGTARLATKLVLRSLTDTTFHLETEALVLPKLTSFLPTRRLLEMDASVFNDLPLADPLFHVPDSIDIILGADVYGRLLRHGLRRSPSSSLIAQDTALGWVISGPVKDGPRHVDADASRVLHCVTDMALDESLQRFWSLEEIPQASKLWTLEEEECDQLFANTHTRDVTGKFTVQLPIKPDLPAVAEDTRRMALGALASIHRRFARDPELAIAYRNFMSTYEDLGHMVRVPPDEIDNSCTWYLPHHAVVQSTSPNRKLRVVFDASRKTSEGHCLNKFLSAGPALQSDLALVLLNWRRYRFAFTADIVKMFRQVRVVPEHQDLQRIVWSPSPSEPPIDYRLTTVTYGTACAPYLAIRTLLQLAKDARAHFPLGADCLENNTYVDDTFAGADDLDVAIRKKTELIEILRSAGIELDKWAANHIDLLPSSTSSLTMDETKTIDSDEAIKTLGMFWRPRKDEFQYTTFPTKELAGASTKRLVLSNISRLFDPLGWLAPVTVVPKILMQDLWLSKCAWDNPLPFDIREKWIEYCHSLESLPTITINRWLGTSNYSDIQIHGFSDASRRAYAAAIYLRIYEGNGQPNTQLLIAKTKIAPVKTVSIPNLELCGAALLVKLTNYVRRLDFLKKLANLHVVRQSNRPNMAQKTPM